MLIGKKNKRKKLVDKKRKQDIKFSPLRRNKRHKHNKEKWVRNKRKEF